MRLKDQTFENVLRSLEQLVLNTERSELVTEHFYKSNTVDSGNSKRLNSEQSLISEHFWCNWTIFL